MESNNKRKRNKRRRNGKNREDVTENGEDVTENGEDVTENNFIVNDYEDLKDEYEYGEIDDEYDDDEYDIRAKKLKSWKKGLSNKIIQRIEPELLQLKNEMKAEIPTIQKILQTCITKSDKKKCLRMLEQLNDKESSDYYRIVDSINEILSSSRSTQKEVEFLEAEEDKLRKMYVHSDSLKNRILKLNAADTIKAKILSQYEEMLTYPTDSHFYNSLREEIEWSLRLPYDNSEEDFVVNKWNNTSINEYFYQIRQKLDNELYGMDIVKDRIIQILNDRRTSGDTCGRNLALVGPPGVGKTAICKLLGNILNKKFAKISCAALDISAIKGSSKVYVSSEPSIILQNLAALKTNSAIIMFDEIDKVEQKVQHALLHVSDMDDNREFQDNYLKNFSHDLSKVFFVYCMNDDKCLNEALRDRFDIVYLEDYNIEEKAHIFKDYMLPKALKTVNMKEKDINISMRVITEYLRMTSNMSLRTIERKIKLMIGKINLYKSVVLPNGTTGNLKLPFVINNFKLPLSIDLKLLIELTE